MLQDEKIERSISFVHNGKTVVFDLVPNRCDFFYLSLSCSKCGNLVPRVLFVLAAGPDSVGRQTVITVASVGRQTVITVQPSHRLSLARLLCLVHRGTKGYLWWERGSCGEGTARD
jgi:hypothetical protein